MAHVLLPCDMPSWVDVRRHLIRLKTCEDGGQMAQIMAKIHEICSVSLDPDDTAAPKTEHPGFRELATYVDDILTPEERSKFLQRALPDIASRALELKILKPEEGFLYSLSKEESVFTLERSFVASLLANAFFSAFPRRTAKTHPTLQDFGMADFFTHLTKRTHQKKLKAFLRYFEKLEPEPKGKIHFTRKVVSGPSLPGWLCSDRPLVPLVVRPEGNVHQADQRVFRACSCAAAVGGDVLKTSSSQEARLFFTFPELLASLSFVENLTDEEALLVEGIRPSSKQITTEMSFCFLDAVNFSDNTERQFEDSFLLRELNKALAAFLHQPRTPEVIQRRHTPVGESSESETRSRDETKRRRHMPHQNSSEDPLLPNKSTHEVKRTTCLPLILKSDNSSEMQSRRVSIPASRDNRVTEWPRLNVPNPKKPIKSESQNSSKISMKTASQSSVELPPIRPLFEDEYYTADEDSGEAASDPETGPCRRGHSKIRKEKRTYAVLSDMVKEESESGSRRISQSISRETSSYSGLSGSGGFALGGMDSEDDLCLNQHERLDDFRKRIRKRTRRRLSRRGSRSSYLGSSGSSDMEDISEDPELPSFRSRVIRPASSEPSLTTTPDRVSYSDILPFSPEALFSLGNKKIMTTSSNGRLKAYSYDGVNPNLPVPFKAKFRRRRHHSEEGEKWLENDFLTSSSVVDWRSSADDLSSCSPSEKKVQMSVEDSLPERWPVAVEPWGCSGEEGDGQLKVLILWLAASMAQLPALILYTLKDPSLHQIVAVYGKVLSRQWTVGDLSCEVLRFCRNRISPKRKFGTPTQLFGQLIGSESSTASSLLHSLSQHSLD